MIVYVLDLRERSVGGAVASGHLWATDGATDWSADSELSRFTAATRDADVALLLHGFNNDRQAGWTSLVRFAGFLDARGVTAILMAVLWPGDGWAKALTYPFEGRDADDSAEALVRWLTHNVHGTARISLVAHSLGCRVAMQTAQRLAEMDWAGVPTIGRICLMAGAIDNDCLGRHGSTCYRRGTLAAEKVAILASREDRVLERAFPIGDRLQNFLYFGERHAPALGRTGAAERDPDVLAKLERIPLSHPSGRIDHGHYFAVEDVTAGHTVAEADTFVAAFLGGAAPLDWAATRPKP